MRDTRLDPLPSELRRRREQAARELETGITWLDGCPPAVGAEVAGAVNELSNVSYRVYERADRRLGYTPSHDSVSLKMLRGEGDDTDRLDAVAAVVGAFVWLAYSAAFQSALTKLSKGETEVALSEAATSLQEFFRALRVDGNSLSNQLDNAANKKVISGADRGLMKPLIDCVNGDRSQRGNAHYHRTGDVSKADAWLMMHVVAAVMVRLSNKEPRDIVAAREKQETDAAAAREEEARLEREAAQAALAAREPDPWERPGQYGDDTPF